jgi:hypothetical protein
MEGYFLSKHFTSAGTESGIGSIEGVSVAGKAEKGCSEFVQNWAKKVWQQEGPFLYKQTEFGWPLEQQ